MTSPDVDAAVDVRLLGPLEVRLAGRPVSLGGPRPRALLTVLALSAGTTVPGHRLVELIWEGEPPATASNVVQVYVSRLRRALTRSPGRPESPSRPESPGRPVLRSGSGGYLLDLPAEAVDALRFERLAAQGHLLLAAADPAAAAEVLGRALALWRGDAVPDLAGLPTGDAVLARLDG